jgi:hypothetical protein
MSYRISVQFNPEGKYPFLLCTEADGIPMTEPELTALHSECERALQAYDDSKRFEYVEHEAADDAEIESHRAEYVAATDERDMEPHKRDGYAEKMADQADYLRKAARENGA